MYYIIITSPLCDLKGIIETVNYQYDQDRATKNRIHLNEVISERFQSNFSEYALMILKRFFALICAFTWTKFSGFLDKFSCTSSFFG